MNLIPCKQKHKKHQKGRIANRINKVFQLEGLKHGLIGLKTLSFGRLTSNQLKAFYFSINKIIKRKGKITINIFPHTPVSKKPIEVRMGKGKGGVNFWVAKVKPGTILCEIDTKFKTLALKALKQAQYRIPLSTKPYFNYDF